MFKLVETEIIDHNKNDYSFKKLFDKYFKKDSNIVNDDIIKQLNYFYKHMFHIDNNTGTEIKWDELAFITNFKYGDISFLIGIYPDGTTGIISEVGIYNRKELLYPFSKDIDNLCETTLIMKNTDMYYSNPTENRACINGIEYKYELLYPDNTNFKFKFNILNDITYGCDNYDATTNDFSKEEILDTLNFNISIINKRLSPFSHIGDFLIGINDYNPKEVAYDPSVPDKFSFYIWEE